MKNPAPADHPVAEVISHRWSPRAFADKPIAPAQLRSLFEAARWAPSSYNEQPWSLIVATHDDPEQYQKVLSCYGEFNQNWVPPAYLIGIAVGKKKFDRGNKPNRHHLHDVGMALQNLAIQATSMGLYSHFMAGFDMDKTRRTFSVPDDHEPATAFCVGHIGSPDALAADLREKELAPRTRKPISSFVFTGKFGDVSPLVGQGGAKP